MSVFSSITSDRQWVFAGTLCFFGWLFMILGNALASTGFGTNETTGSISDEHPTPITPAGPAFSIWGLIFVAVFFYPVMHFIPALRTPAHTAMLRPLTALFLLNTIVNGFWNLPWVYGELVVALVLMLIILFTLISLYVLLSAAHGLDDPSAPPLLQLIRSPNSRRAVLLRLGAYWTVRFWNSMYLGWISAATCVNLTIVLRYNAGWAPEDPTAWAIVVLVTVGALAVAMAVLRLDAVYPAVIAWASFWINYAHHHPKPLFTPYPRVADAALGVGIVAVVFAAGALIARVGIRRSVLPHRPPTPGSFSSMA